MKNLKAMKANNLNTDHLVIVHYILEDIYFAIGSVCIQRFDEENCKDLYTFYKARIARIAVKH